MEQEKPKYEGVPVYLDGREYIVPSLSVRQFREHYAKLTAPQAAGETVAQFLEDRIPIICAALRRNYPGVTEDQLLDIIDLGSFDVITKAIQAASGMKRVKPGESTPAAAAEK
jgi:hypothetical protein